MTTSNATQSFYDKLKRFLKELFKQFDFAADFELALAALVVGIVIILAPILLALHFINTHRYIHASVISVLWLVCLVRGLGDLKKKRLSWPTATLIIAWIVLSFVLAVFIA